MLRDELTTEEILRAQEVVNRRFPGKPFFTWGSAVKGLLAEVDTLSENAAAQARKIDRLTRDLIEVEQDRQAAVTRLLDSREEAVRLTALNRELQHELAKYRRGERRGPGLRNLLFGGPKKEDTDD